MMDQYIEIQQSHMHSTPDHCLDSVLIQGRLRVQLIARRVEPSNGLMLLDKKQKTKHGKEKNTEATILL
jgi:hypothetical protein